MSAVAHLRPGVALEAAGYIRVSRKVQAEGHSPIVQRDAIKQLALQEGYALTMVEEDHERGSKVSRAGYQKIIEAVRAGTIHAVLVFMFDRFGRDGGEWLTRAREFERLGVPIISVQEGKDEGGLIRFMRAGMAEEYSRQLARRVLPARERAARMGIHMGPTPYGYKRVYPTWDGQGRRPPADLLPDIATAWVVSQMFAHYAGGGWSIGSLAEWLNGDERIPTPRKRPYWGAGTVRKMLRQAVYMGCVEHNKRPMGIYERAAPGSAFIAPGRHEALVPEHIWHEVQRRMDAAYHRPSSNSVRPSVLLATGLLRCDHCHGPMVSHALVRGGTAGQYVCNGYYKRQNGCQSRSYRIDVAHAALLAEVRRLRGAPWTPQAEQALMGSHTRGATDAAATARALEDERERLRRHTRRMSELDDDPTPEQIAAFREVSAEISARIRALEAQMQNVSHLASRLPDLRALHARLSTTELRDVVDPLVGHAANS